MFILYKHDKCFSSDILSIKQKQRTRIESYEDEQPKHILYKLYGVTNTICLHKRNVLYQLARTLFCSFRTIFIYINFNSDLFECGFVWRVIHANQRCLFSYYSNSLSKTDNNWNNIHAYTFINCLGYKSIDDLCLGISGAHLLKSSVKMLFVQ